MYIIAYILRKYFWKDSQNTKNDYLSGEGGGWGRRNRSRAFSLHVLYNLNFTPHGCITYASNREKEN
jgi:hypothetical protein